MAVEQARSVSEPPPSDRLGAGQMIGTKYRLVRQLDEGAMGTVWVAHNLDLDIPVAIKLIRAEAQSAETAQRLANEARILARLGHPAILKVYDFGKTDAGDPFIVMELLHGECLDSALDSRGKLGALWAVQLLLPIAEGLGVAHDRGIVHRDLKPANIFLAQTLSGHLQPKILDFGIAQTAEPDSTRLTRDGSLMGSPVYMSPEQARGQRNLDLRTDVWAFCVVLYEAITGNLPFDGEDYYDVLHSIVHDTPVPTTDLCAGDRSLWEIIDRGLHKDREHRWPSMRELGTALAQWLLGHEIAEDASRASLYAVWLAPESARVVSSFPPVTLSQSSRPPISSSPRAVTQPPTVRPPPHSAVLLRSPGRRLSTGGHGALALRATERRTRPQRGRSLVIAGATLVLIGAGSLAWALRSPAAGTDGSSAASAAAAPSMDWATASALVSNEPPPRPPPAVGEPAPADVSSALEPTTDPEPVSAPTRRQTEPESPVRPRATSPTTGLTNRPAVEASPPEATVPRATQSSRQELKSPY